ncbi:hypothetical protein GN956_G8685 [Arapaima gigas]
MTEGLRLSEHTEARCLTDTLRVRFSRAFVEQNNVTLFVRDRKATSHVLSPTMNAKCGYKRQKNYSGGLELWASFTACHMYLQHQSTRLRISVGVKYVPLDLSWSGATEHVYFSCPYNPSNADRLVCEEAYIEVQLHGSLCVATRQSPLLFEVQSHNGEIMTRGQKWISDRGIQLRFNHPAGWMTLRVPLNSSVISRKDYNGFQSVGYNLMVKGQDALANLQYDLSAQCPLVQVMCQEGDVLVSTANLRFPGLMDGVEDQAVRMQLDGVTLSQVDAVSKGYKVFLERHSAQLSFAARTNPSLDRYNNGDFVVNKHRLALVLLWVNKKERQHGRDIIHIPPHSCHPQHQDPIFTGKTDGFNVTYGPVPLSYSLSATSVDGVHFQSPGESWAELQTHLLPGHDSYHVSFFGHFGSELIPWKYLGNLSSQYSIQPILVFSRPEEKELIVEGQVYTHIREDIVLPGVEGYCQDQSVCFNITKGNAPHLWTLYIWDSPFTNGWRTEQQHSMDDSMKLYQLCVGVDSHELLHQSVSEQGQSLVLGMAFRDKMSGEVKVWAQQACPFPPAQELACSAEGVIRVRGLQLISSPAARPELLTLLDSSCKPSEVSFPKVSFIFSISTCGTVKKVQDNIVEYENKISNVKSLDKSAPEYLKIESTLVCRYRNPGVITIERMKNLKSNASPVHAHGNLQFHMDVMKDWTFSTAFRPDEYPITKRLREPVLVEVGVDSDDPAVELYLHDCWATPTLDPAHPHIWFLIKDGCEVTKDKYKTVFHKVELSNRIKYPQHYKRFEVKTFTFVNPDSRELLTQPIIIHCTVVICDLGSLTTDRACNVQCNVDRQRKGEVCVSKSIPEFQLTSGSIQLMSDILSTGALLGEEELMLILLSVIGIFSSLVFLGVICVSQRQRLKARNKVTS